MGTRLHLSPLAGFAVVALLLLSLLAATAHAADATIFTPSSQYVYYGCYNETTDLPNTDHSRAITGGPGTHEVLPGNMTAPLCLAYCTSNSPGGKAYKFVGLEYARECWCGSQLSGLAAKLSDGECNLSCEGNQTQACGGQLKLTVYTLAGNPSARIATGAVVLAVAVASLNFF